MSVETSLGTAAQAGSIDFRDARFRPNSASTARERFAWRYTAMVVAVPVLSLAICIAATRTNMLAPQTIRPNILVTGVFNVIGFSLSTAELIPLVIVTVLAYLMAMRVCDRVSARTVIASVVFLNVVAVLAPPLFSTDPFSYQAYARMLVTYHTNPYTHGPSAILLDPIYYYIGALWINTPTVYGPLFTLVTAPLGWASIAVSEISFKVIAGLCSAGTLWLVWKSASLRGVNPVRALALFGLNPVILLSGVAGGHNDSLATLLLMLGVYAALKAHDRSAGALFTAGAAVKLTGALIVPFALLSRAGANANLRRGRLLTGVALVGIPILAVSIAVFGSGMLQMFSTLQHSQSKGAWQSLPGFVLVITHLRATSLAHDAVNVVIAGLLGRLLWLVWAQRMDWLEGATWATVAVLATAWSMLPWYVTWLMPLAALCAGVRIRRASLVMTAVAGAIMVANCVPGGIGWLGT